MSSLGQILAEHGSLLVLDASGSAQAAWFAAPGTPAVAAREAGDAGVGLFRAVGAICPRPSEAGAFAFCAAPGSVLGIRTAATAIRSWNALSPRPVYSYHALELAAANDGHSKAFIADARRGQWHFLIAGEPPRQLSTADLTAARGTFPLVALEGYRHWEPLPDHTIVQPYNLGPFMEAAVNVNLFQRNDLPDAMLIAQPSYVQWKPRIHQTP